MFFEFQNVGFKIVLKCVGTHNNVWCQENSFLSPEIRLGILAAATSLKLSSHQHCFRLLCAWSGYLQLFDRSVLPSIYWWLPKAYLDLLCTLEARASLVAQLVKNLPVMQENWVASLGWDEFLACCVEHGVGLPTFACEPETSASIGSQRVRHDWRDSADRQVILLLKILDDYHLNLQQSSKSWAWVS